MLFPIAGYLSSFQSCNPIKDAVVNNLVSCPMSAGKFLECNDWVAGSKFIVMA